MARTQDFVGSYGYNDNPLCRVKTLENPTVIFFCIGRNFVKLPLCRRRVTTRANPLTGWFTTYKNPSFPAPPAAATTMAINTVGREARTGSSLRYIRSLYCRQAYAAAHLIPLYGAYRQYSLMPAVLYTPYNRKQQPHYSQWVLELVILKPDILFVPCGDFSARDICVVMRSIDWC